MSPNPGAAAADTTTDTETTTSTTTTTTTTTRRSKESHHRSSGSSSSRKKKTAKKAQDIAAYIPSYLRPYVFPYHDDFCYSRNFHFSLLAQLMAEGFLPICSHQWILLPKLHQQRSCIALQPTQHSLLPHLPATENTSNTPFTQPSSPSTPSSLPPPLHVPSSVMGALHTPRSVRKKAKRYWLTWNQEFHQVVQACHEQFGPSCWLYPPMVRGLAHLHQATPQEPATSAQDKKIKPVRATVATNLTNLTNQMQQVPVRMYSIELWAEQLPEDDDDNQKEKDQATTTNSNKNHANKKDKKAQKGATVTTNDNDASSLPSRRRLVAGELGYAVGAVYTSMTGFSKESSAGSVQLASLGALLQQSGFCVWDLGMDMAYKQDLGAILVDRDHFVDLIHHYRTHDCQLDPTTPRNARQLIDQHRESP